MAVLRVVSAAWYFIRVVSSSSVNKSLSTDAVTMLFCYTAKQSRVWQTSAGFADAQSACSSTLERRFAKSGASTVDFEMNARVEEERQ